MQALQTIVAVAAIASAGLWSNAAHAAILFADDFDLPSGSSYNVNADPDSQITFTYNYSQDGIPAAPNSVGGTTLGVKFEANLVLPTGTQALNISPIGQAFSEDFALKFDMWINVNGPFPLGGTGSTEFITAGVGTTGFNIQKSSGSADGTWFAVDGEGGSGIDFRAYRGVAIEGSASGTYTAPVDGVNEPRDADNIYYHTAFPGGQQAPELQQMNYPAQTGSLKAGTVGFAWRAVEITKIGSTVTWTIDGLPIATITDATFSGDNIFVGYWDAFASVSDNPATSFGLIDNLRVEAIPEPSCATLGVLGAGACLVRRRRKPAVFHRD